MAFTLTFALFVMLVGTCDATGESEDYLDTTLKNICIFNIVAVLLLIIINVTGFVLTIQKLHFLESSNNTVSQKVNELGLVTGTVAEKMSKRIGNLCQELRNHAERTRNSLNRVVDSIYQFSFVLGHYLVPKQDAATDPLPPDTWVDLEMGMSHDTPVQESSINLDLEDLEEESFYYF